MYVKEGKNMTEEDIILLLDYLSDKELTGEMLNLKNKLILINEQIKCQHRITEITKQLSV